MQITFKTGVPDESDIAKVAQQRKLAIAREAQIKRARAITDARAAELRKLPFLDSGNAVTFLGADRKCALQFQDALKMEGLEKRKRIAELVSYSCGSLIDSPVRVFAGQQEGVFTMVTMAEGKHAKKTGWVPSAWIK